MSNPKPEIYRVVCSKAGQYLTHNGEWSSNEDLATEFSETVYLNTTLPPGSFWVIRRIIYPAGSIVKEIFDLLEGNRVAWKRLDKKGD